MTEKTIYVDKFELLELLEKKIKADNERRMAVVDSDFIALVNDATEINDVAPVVRCKDCKRSGVYAFGCGDREHLACLEIEEDGFVRMAISVNDDDYCSHGEKKNE